MTKFMCTSIKNKNEKKKVFEKGYKAKTEM